MMAEERTDAADVMIKKRPQLGGKKAGLGHIISLPC